MALRPAQKHPPAKKLTKETFKQATPQVQAALRAAVLRYKAMRKDS